MSRWNGCHGQRLQIGVGGVRWDGSLSAGSRRVGECRLPAVGVRVDRELLWALHGARDEARPAGDGGRLATGRLDDWTTARWTTICGTHTTDRLDSTRLGRDDAICGFVQRNGARRRAPKLLASPGDPVGMWLSCGGGSTVGLARNYRLQMLRRECLLEQNTLDNSVEYLIDR